MSKTTPIRRRLLLLQMFIKDGEITKTDVARALGARGEIFRGDIHYLRTKGYEFDNEYGKGYKLLNPPKIEDVEDCMELLETLGLEEFI